MTTSRTAPAAAKPASAALGLSAALAPSVLGFAALLATVGDVLLTDGPTGLGCALWVALLAAALVALSWRANVVVGWEAGLWLIAAVALAAGVAWRDSDILRFFDF